MHELLHLLPGGALLLHDHRVQAINAAGARAFGATPEDLAGRLITELVDSSCAASLRNWLEQPRSGGQHSGGFFLPLAPPYPDSTLVVKTGPAHQAGGAWQVLLIETIANQEGEVGPTSLVNRLFPAHEEERYGTVRALHDGPSQALAAIRMSAYGALHELDPLLHTDELQNILAQADVALGQLRSLSNYLQPPQLRSLGLEAALRWYVGEINKDIDLPINLELLPLPRRPTRHVEEAGFRIAQEALANALRHAGAEHITACLQAGEDVLTMEIRDDGRGFDPQLEPGDGLAEMRARAQGIGGRLSVTSSPGCGTCVIVRLPWH
ncbi:ATP-binding protein [Luteimonas sp. A478]